MSSDKDEEELVLVPLSREPPITVDRREWPEIATGTYRWQDGDQKKGILQEISLVLKVRQHADGRAVVYGRFFYCDILKPRDLFLVHHGRFVEPGMDLVAAIQAVGGNLRTAMTEIGGPSAEEARRVSGVVLETIQELPPTRL